MVWSSSGTTQGDPLGPALFAFAMLKLTEELARLVRAGVLCYLDDGHVVGPAAEVARFAAAVVGGAADDLTHDMQRRTGCAVEVEKCSLWHRDHIEYELAEDIPNSFLNLWEGLPVNTPEADTQPYLVSRPRIHAECRERAARCRADHRVMFPERLHGMRGLREPAESNDPRAEIGAQRGVLILGSPVVGTPDFIDSAMEATLTAARAYVQRAQEVLLPSHPDAYLGLMRTTLPPRFSWSSI